MIMPFEKVSREEGLDSACNHDSNADIFPVCACLFIAMVKMKNIDQSIANPVAPIQPTI
jgi:hypothetical protein